jgi:ribonucleoside-triphosphate reductase
MVKKVLSNFRLPYITITPVFSVCPTHGYLSGEHEFCPKCDDELLEKLKIKENSYEHSN